MRLALRPLTATAVALALVGCATAAPEETRCVAGSPLNREIAAWQGWEIHDLPAAMLASRIERYRRPEAGVRFVLPDQLLIMVRNDSETAVIVEAHRGCAIVTQVIPRGLAKSILDVAQGRGS